ncbi:hypothetical protein O181_077036 [Austropuccinia psidii MF-1]|uniref:Mannosyltransferase n=1 Tax=Austropuccinia psidii MF-1 TaxID=1389203 RepID=A0A9Q3FHC6_9BASI|nr:hypothetical protein [Austropuccinia psidii MF-1]
MRSDMIFILTALLLFAVGLLLLLISPYTKVEESFNLHAIHDFIHLPNPSAVAHFGDHTLFPGPVPRTFIGALAIAFIARPLIFVFNAFGFTHSKFAEQILARHILGIFNSSSLVYFGLCSRFVFGDLAAILMLLLSACQFHLAFYSSRTLPNMFAFPLVQIAIGQYMVTMRRGQTSPIRKRRTLRACSFLTFAAIVFRLELLGLLAPITLLSLVSKRVTFWELVRRGFLATFAALEMTLPVDSYFWQKLTWPEGTSVIFNVLAGNSKKWGVMPWHFYFTSALPKLLGISYPFAILGFILNRKLLILGLSTLVFIGLMSILDHKESRFIIYVIPLWNLSTSVGVNRLSSFFSYPKWVKLCLFSLIGALTILSTILSTYLSIYNYPGGLAMTSLHSNTNFKSLPHLRIHLDDLVCQTGASRFLQLNDKEATLKYAPSNGKNAWEYDKIANLTFEANQFDLILSERSEILGFEAIEHFPAFERIDWQKFPGGPAQYIWMVLGNLCSHIKRKQTIGKTCKSIWSQFSPFRIVLNKKRVTLFSKQKN